MRSRPTVIVTALLVLVVDQISKRWALGALASGRRIDIVGEWVQLRLTANSGAAFSMGTGVTWVFTALALIVVLALIWTAGNVVHRGWLTGMGGLAGGAAGNLTDRLTQPPSFGMGHVVDFIAFPNFPVFNIADMAIVGSVALLFVLSAKGIPLGDRDGLENRDV